MDEEALYSSVQRPSTGNGASTATPVQAPDAPGNTQQDADAASHWRASAGARYGNAWVEVLCSISRVLLVASRTHAARCACICQRHGGLGLSCATAWLPTQLPESSAVLKAGTMQAPTGGAERGRQPEQQPAHQHGLTALREQAPRQQSAAGLGRAGPQLTLRDPQKHVGLTGLWQPHTGVCCLRLPHM